MLDFFRSLRPLDRFVFVPWILIFPVFAAWGLRGPIVAAHGAGAYGVTIVAMLVAALAAVLLVRNHADEYPATIALGGLVMSVAELILYVVSWHRLALILMAFVHALAIALAVYAHLEKKRDALGLIVSPQVVDEFDDGDDRLERDGVVTFSMAKCGDSACFCSKDRLVA